MPEITVCLQDHERDDLAVMAERHGVEPDFVATLIVRTALDSVAWCVAQGSPSNGPSGPVNLVH